MPAAILAAVIEDASTRSGADADDIDVVRAESITWPSGALGCPEPGMMYTQALVDGYWVVLGVGGDEYDYRIVSGGSFRLCERNLPPAGG